MQESQETQIRSLGWEDTLRDEMQPTLVFLPRKIPWTEEPGGLQSLGSQRIGHDWATKRTARPVFGKMLCVCSAHTFFASVDFSWQEYWSGLPFLLPGDLPNPGIESVSPVSPALAGGFFTTEAPGKMLEKCKPTGIDPRARLKWSELYNSPN